MLQIKIILVLGVVLKADTSILNTIHSHFVKQLATIRSFSDHCKAQVLHQLFLVKNTLHSVSQLYSFVIHILCTQTE